jgi:antigen flippase
MKEILRASIIVGAGSLATMVSGLIRNKVIALLLGPTGMGLFGLFNSTLSTASTLCGMGLSTSAVREIAQAKASNDATRLSVTRIALILSSIVLGFLGALMILIFCRPIAQLVMADPAYSIAIAVLGIGVWASTIHASQMALLNGLRRLADLTWVTALASFSGMVAAILAVFLWETDGVIIAVVSLPILSLSASCWFAYRIKGLAPSKLTWQSLFEPIRSMFTLGMVFLLTAFMAMGTQLLVRSVILRSLGIEATGEFQAAWSISMLYISFVLGAMGTDYYPRLTAVADDPQAVNKMVNDQAEAALLLSGPVILGMLTFAPQVITLLYSADFVNTADLLRWQVLGDIFKVASWPVGFILLAQGRAKIFFCTELCGNGIYLAAIIIGLETFGVRAAGIAHLACYGTLFFALLIIAYRITQFKWLFQNTFILTALSLFAALVVAGHWFKFASPILLGSILTSLACVYASVRIVSGMSRNSSPLAPKP